MSSALPSQEPDVDDVHRHVREMYTAVAVAPAHDLHFPVGRKAAEHVGYPVDELDALPPGALESFAGVGYPFEADGIRPGDTVLDIGSGSGTDLLLAARRAGPTGRAFGLDFTAAMMRKALSHAREAVFHNAFVLRGDAGREVPVPDESIDVVTSNGVLNLIPEKLVAFREAHRVLVPGGRLQIADIIVSREIPGSARCDGELWAACIAGADVEDRYLNTMRLAGFEDVRVLRRVDYFSAAPRDDSRRTAKRYGAEALVIAARKASA